MGSTPMSQARKGRTLPIRMKISLATLTLLAPGSIAAACTTFCLGDGRTVVFGRNYDFEIGDGLVIVNKRNVVKVSAVGTPTHRALLEELQPKTAGSARRPKRAST